MYVILSACLSVCLSVRPSVRASVRPSFCLSMPSLSEQTISQILVKFGTVLYRNLLNKQKFRSHRLNESCFLQILVVHIGVAEVSGPHHLLEDPKPQPYLHEERK
jgi:hypothetical protein